MLGLFVQTSLLHAELRDAEAQYNFAILHQHGKGVEQDDKKALHWYTRAAKQGFAKAQYALGKMYFEMSDRERTLYYKKVLHWYTKAAEQGHMAAQYDLGMLYYTGSGVAVDDIQALDWITKSAKQGYLPAHSLLEEITKSQNRAKVCLENQYQDC